MHSRTYNKMKLNAITQRVHCKTELKVKDKFQIKQLATKRDSAQRYIGALSSPKNVTSQKSLNSPQEKLSSMIFLTKSEKNVNNFKIPTLQLRVKNKTKMSLKTPKISYSFTPVELTLYPNSETIFVIKSPIPDLISFKAIQVNRFELTKNNISKDIYLMREQLLTQLQIRLNVPRIYHNLSLFNNQPIQFFQEIPEVCNLIFLSCSMKQDFWTLLFSYHNTPYTQERLNRLLNIIQQINTLEDLTKLLMDKEIFHCQMEQRQLDRFDPFLIELAPEYQVTKSLYQSSKVYEQQNQDELANYDYEQLTARDNKSIEKENEENNQELDDEILERRAEQQKDFSILRCHPKPCEVQQMLDKEGLGRRISERAPSRYLKLPDYKKQYSNFLKNQSHRSRHENQYTNFADHIARNLPPMTAYNIPKLMNETGLDRQEIYEVYSRYKALLSYECNQIPGMTKKMVPNGISLEAFNAGLDEMSMAPQGVVDQLFNFFAKQNCLTFEGFLNAINLIKAKKNDNKIELILKLIDENQNGLLSFDEIMNRCTLMMEDTLKGYDSQLSIENMVNYITRSIFDAVKTPYDEEIPIQKIRSLIESKSQEAKFLIMMCCGDVNYIE